MSLDAVNDLLATEQKPEPVVQNGQYVIPRGGDRFTRATTFASTIDDRFSLERWQQRMTAEGMILRPDLRAKFAALDADNDKQERNAVCEEAIEAAKGHAGANLGTALHTFAEKVDRGEEIFIPEPWDKDIAAYTATLQANGVRVDPNLMEGVVVCRDLGVAGRFDRIVTIDGYPTPLIADLKTGSINHSLGTIAVQLAIYAYADELYDPDTDTLTPMPRVDQRQALIIHLPVGEAKCTLHMVDIAAGWEAAQLCAQVRQWRTRRGLGSVFEATGVQRHQWLTARVATLKTEYPAALTELAARWPAGLPTLKAGGHSDAQLTEIDRLLSDVEARYSVDFGEPDPARRRPPVQVIEALSARASALPADIVAMVERRAEQEKIPSIRTRRFVTAHVDPLEQILGEFEAAYQGRLEHVRKLIGEITDGDVDLAKAVAGVAGIGWEDDHLLTERDVRTLEIIRQGMSDLALGYVEVDGRIQVGCLNAEHRLTELFGSKRDALAACKQLAEQHDLSKPRSVADAAADPVLFALAISTTNQSNSEQAQTGEAA